MQSLDMPNSTSSCRIDTLSTFFPGNIGDASRNRLVLHGERDNGQRFRFGRHQPVVVTPAGAYRQLIENRVLRKGARTMRTYGNNLFWSDPIEG